MSVSDTNKPSKTDWARLDAMTDEEIDTSDIPVLDDDFFERASLRIPERRVDVTLRVDANVLAWFKAQGEDYEERLNAALRIYAAAHHARH